MQKHTAIVLTSKDIGEFDRLYTLYTEESGIVRAVGKGVRKQAAKLAGHLEPVTLSEIYVARSKGIGQITSAMTIADFGGVKKNIESLTGALEINLFFEKNFSEGEKDWRIFDLLKKFLALSGEDKWQSKRQVIQEAFWWKLFDFLGVRPEVAKCARCRNFLQEEKIYFSAERGGTVCEKCLRDEKGIIDISAYEVKLIRVFLANSLEKVLKISASAEKIERLKKIRKIFAKFGFGDRFETKGLLL